MLPKIHRPIYLSFQRTLQRLQTQMVGDRSTLKPLVQVTFQEVQTLFQEQMLPLNFEMDTANAAKLRSFQVEINKQIHLLATDLLFCRQHVCLLHSSNGSSKSVIESLCCYGTASPC
ncbi:MAG: heterocyst frequency control protein PatD [Leptolyngbyaceae cyanobacterium CRU_2_3]|nr:heterocyst frequency control protein PatD [Leptolyngbyaceae cyanobacterium CRU_2_3]